MSIDSVSDCLCLPLFEVWWSKAHYQRKGTSSNLYFAAESQGLKDSETSSNNSPQGDCDFLKTKGLVNVHEWSWATNVQVKHSKPESCFGTNVGADKVKIEKISIVLGVLHCFSRSLGSSIMKFSAVAAVLHDTDSDCSLIREQGAGLLWPSLCHSLWLTSWQATACCHWNWHWWNGK